MYNPFSKQIGAKLEEEDLAALLGEVAEGYYVEYKQDLPTNKKIAHSIASFANTYGGWYLVGIRTDAHHVASEICGFDPATHADPVATVRDVIKSRIDPVPFAQIQVVSLSNGLIVLAAHVPPRQRKPFVTYDGRVYRRNHDASDPVYEDRRHTLDQLVQEGREHGKRFARFRSVEEEPSQFSDDRRAWLNLYLVPDPDSVFVKDVHTTRGVGDILALSRQPRTFLPGHDDLMFSLPFSHAYRSFDSVRLRQAQPGDLTSTRLVLELFQNGAARIHLPIRVRSLRDAIGSPMQSVPASEALRAALRGDADGSGDSLHVRVFPAADVMLQVMLIVSIYEAWLGPNAWNPDFLMAFSIRGGWSTCPFVDADGWAEQARTWGLPVIPRDVVVPDDAESAIVVTKESPDLSMALEVVFNITAAMGLQSDLVGPGLVEAIARQAPSQPPSA